jgi:hypothetical protein
MFTYQMNKPKIHLQETWTHHISKQTKIMITKD